MNIVPNSTEMLAFTKERGGTAESRYRRGPDRTDTEHEWKVPVPNGSIYWLHVTEDEVVVGGLVGAH